MEKTVSPFEYVSVKRAYEEGRFLIADDMGMFKTAQAILVNNKIRQRKPRLKTLVVCPTSVKEHWAREVQEWGFPKSQDTLVLGAHNYNSDLHMSRRSDWTVVSYPLLARLGDEGLRTLGRAGFNHVILDEVHNAKNPEAIRSRAVRRLTERSEYLTLLSGTPMPNTVEDIYMLMHLLEPETYPISEEHNINREARLRFKALYWERPEEFKELIHRKMIRRDARDYVGQRLPTVEERNHFVDMSGEWLDIYNSILDENLPLGEKIIQLEKALLDTTIVDPSFSSRENASLKYEALDEVVDEEARKGKVLIFTNLKVGIVDSLVERFGRYGAISITGDIPTGQASRREELRQQFQRDPNTRVLIATDCMNEGVDMTAATAVVNLTQPWTPAAYSQRRKRSDRPGEVTKEQMRVHNFLARYPDKHRKSLDQAKQDMVIAKQHVSDYLLSGLEVSREQFAELQTPNSVPRIRQAIKSNGQVVFEHYVKWRGIGTEGALRRLKSRPNRSKHVAEIYPSFRMAKNSADLYLPVIRELEPEHPWLDLAGGPGMLSYHSGQPAYTVDIDFNHLLKGQELGSGKHINGSFSDIPILDGSIGLEVLSLAFQMSEPTQERSKVLREMSRTLKMDGYGIITIPTGYMSPQDRERLRSSFQDYGLEHIDKYHGVGLGHSKLELYVVRKIGLSQDRITDLTFVGDGVKRK